MAKNLPWNSRIPGNPSGDPISHFPVHEKDMEARKQEYLQQMLDARTPLPWQLQGGVGGQSRVVEYGPDTKMTHEVPNPLAQLRSSYGQTIGRSPLVEYGPSGVSVTSQPGGMPGRGPGGMPPSPGMFPGIGGGQRGMPQGGGGKAGQGMPRRGMSPRGY